MSKQKTTATTIARTINLLIPVFMLIAIYILGAKFFETHFFPRCTINGESAAFATPEEMTSFFADKQNGYIINIHGVKDEQINGADCDVRTNEEDAFTPLLKEQNPYKWILFPKVEYNDVKVAEISKKKVKKQAQYLYCLNNPYPKASKNAKCIYNSSSERFEIKKEEYGTKVDQKAFYKNLYSNMEMLNEDMNLEDGSYVSPKITSSSERLNAAVNMLNACLDATITYILPDGNKDIPSDSVAQWVSADKNLDIHYSDRKMRQYLYKLDDTYNTINKEKQIKTPDGKTVSISAGDYGWGIDIEKEIKELKKDLKNGQPVKRLPALINKSYDSNTYVEIDVPQKKAYMYVKGRSVYSGKFTSKKSMPSGKYNLSVKKSRLYFGTAGLEKKNFPDIGDEEYDEFVEAVPSGAYVAVIVSPDTITVTESMKNVALVEHLIDGIGSLSYSKEANIKAARKAYNNLTSSEQKKVTNYSKLTYAEGKIDSVVKAHQEQQKKELESRIKQEYQVNDDGNYYDSSTDSDYDNSYGYEEE